MTERRVSPVRREFNEIIRDPSGRVSEAKVWSQIYKGALLWAFLQHTKVFLADWTLLAMVIVAGIAPDLLKKMLSAKLGVAK